MTDALKQHLHNIAEKHTSKWYTTDVEKSAEMGRIEKALTELANEMQSQLDDYKLAIGYASKGDMDSMNATLAKYE